MLGKFRKFYNLHSLNTVNSYAVHGNITHVVNTFCNTTDNLLIESGRKSPNLYSNSDRIFIFFNLKGPNHPQKLLICCRVCSPDFRMVSLFLIPPGTCLKLAPKFNYEASVGTQKVSTYLTNIRGARGEILRNEMPI